MGIQGWQKSEKPPLRLAWEEQVYNNLKELMGINPDDPRLARFEVILDQQWEFGDIMSVSLGIGVAFYAELTLAAVRAREEETFLWMRLRSVLFVALANKFITQERYTVLWDLFQKTAYDAALRYSDEMDQGAS